MINVQIICYLKFIAIIHQFLLLKVALKPIQSYKYNSHTKIQPISQNTTLIQDIQFFTHLVGTKSSRTFIVDVIPNVS